MPLKFVLGGAIAVVIAATHFGAPVRAAVLGVQDIRITSALAGTPEGYIQVGELIAVQAGTGTDVAAASQGATATAFSTYGGASSSVGNTSFAIDGSNSGVFPSIYASAGTSTSEFLDVSLYAPTDLSSITIYGRSDCCAYRDLYNVTLSDANGTVVFSGQIDGTADGSAAAVLVLPTTMTIVPEPASMAALLTGLLGMTSIRRRAARQR